MKKIEDHNTLVSNHPNYVFLYMNWMMPNLDRAESDCLMIILLSDSSLDKRSCAKVYVLGFYSGCACEETSN